MHNEAKPILYFGHLGRWGGRREVLYRGHVGGRYTFLTFEHGELDRNLAPSQM